MSEKRKPCWIDPDGNCHLLGGKGHSEYAYDVLYKELLGKNMQKKPQLDGSTKSKGKSGEVAAAEAHKELGGNPKDPKHSEALCNRGWVQASDDGTGMLVRALCLDAVSMAWAHLAPLFQARESAVFAIGDKKSGVSAGLSRKDLSGTAESVIDRIKNAIAGKPSEDFSQRWSSQNHGIRYFE